MKFISERIEKIKEEQSSVIKKLQEDLKNKTDNTVSILSKYLMSSDVVDQFTSWTLDDVPNMGNSWEETENNIQKSLLKRLEDAIVAWEEVNHVFANALTSLVQNFRERYNLVEGQLRILENAVLAEDAACLVSSSWVSDNSSIWSTLSVAERIIIVVSSPIWVPIGLVALIVGAPVVGVMAILKMLQHRNKEREYQKDECCFMAKASKQYLTRAAEEKNLRPYVVEQLKESQVFLKQIEARIPVLIEAETMLCQQLREDSRSQKEIEDSYQPLYDRTLKLRQHAALFGIKELRTMDISCSDLDWKEDKSSLLGTNAFASFYRGKLHLRGEEQPVALKVWKEELTESNACAFLGETETLR